MTQTPEDTLKAAVPFKSGELSVLILTANSTQDLEFFYPYYRFIEEGFNVDVATPDGGEFKGKNGFGLKKPSVLLMSMKHSTTCSIFPAARHLLS